MIEHLNDVSIITSIIQIVLGGLVFSLFKIWLLREDDLNKTITLKKERKHEEVCDLMQNLLERAINDDIPLRGNGGKHPDVVLACTKRIISVSNEFEHLKKTKKIINNLNTYLIVTSVLGFFFLIIAKFMESNFYIISILSLITIISQTVVFIIIRVKGNGLSKFEDL
jgi:hypothetical protein